MQLVRQKKCSLWLFLAGLLICVLMTTIIFDAITAHEKYRKTVQPNLPLNADTLHLFIRERLKRYYVRLTAKPLPDESPVPSFRIYTTEEDIASLESNLPSSAKTQFKSGHIQVDDPEFTSAMEFRYRGGLPLHWLYKKKSLRIKLPPFTLFQGAKSYNLVNPSTLHTITDVVSYDMARETGLLTPDYYPARVFINNRYNGLHYFLNQIDESFLRKNRRMPGSIYTGDNLYIPNPFGKDKEGVQETSFLNDNGESLLWFDERLWEKDAARNAEMEKDRTDITKFIAIANENDPHQFYQDFLNYMDAEKFYLFWGLDTVLGSYHHDNFHNHKIYFDPYLGRFEPIQWDIRFWSRNFVTKLLPVNNLIKRVILNPALEYERDRIAYKLHQQFPVDDVFKRLDKTSALIRPELAADPYRHYPDSRYSRFQIDKEVPFTLAEYDQAVAELKLIYQHRHSDLQNIYDHSLVSYQLHEEAGKHLITIAVNGNSPVLMKFSENEPAYLRGLKRQHNRATNTVSLQSGEMLYPGRRIIDGNPLGRGDAWSILAFGRERLLASPLYYTYEIDADLKTSITEHMRFKNAITGKLIEAKAVDELPDNTETASIHPWDITLQSDESVESIELSGDITINSDQIYPRNSIVTILPGTKIRLAENASMVFYGKLMAKGTETALIQFNRLHADKPWGSIVIQGQAASGTELEYIEVSGGSITSQRLINYPGQLNIHDLATFKLSNCIIKDNVIGDDSLHISYSKGTVSHCYLENTAFDAIDIDIAEVGVSDLEFRNVGNDALDLMTSIIDVENLNIHSAGDKCFSVGEGTRVNIRNSRLANCNIGVAVKDESEARLENLDFSEYRQAAIALYRKNPRYAKGGTVHGKQLRGLNLDNIEADESSNESYSGI